METKREKFVRLANARTNKVLEMIALIGNLGNKSNYEYTETDVEKIFRTIENELKEARKKFSLDNNNDKKIRKFTLE